MNILFELLFYNNFQVEWFFCTKENAVFSLKDLFVVHRKQNLKTLPKITQIKEISAWVSHFPRHFLIPVQNDSVLSSLTGSTLPISSKYQNGLKLVRILPPFWILMNGISVDEDYIFFGYIIPTFKNSIKNIQMQTYFFISYEKLGLTLNIPITHCYNTIYLYLVLSKSLYKNLI